MPITVRWDNEDKTIIYYVFDRRWTWDEFNVVYQDVYRMLDTVDHTVHAIVDLHNSQLLPADTLTHMRRLTFQQHDNGGITVIITTNFLAQSLYSILSGVYRKALEIFKLAPTVEEAYAIIEREQAQITSRV